MEDLTDARANAFSIVTHWASHIYVLNHRLEKKNFILMPDFLKKHRN